MRNCNCSWRVAGSAEWEMDTAKTIHEFMSDLGENLSVLISVTRCPNGDLIWRYRNGDQVSFGGDTQFERLFYGEDPLTMELALVKLNITPIERTDNE